jgi:heptose I phosphotransferase
MEAGFWGRLFRGDSRVYSSGELEGFAGPDWSRRIMDVPVTDRLHVKQGRSIGRLVFKSANQSLTVYLKRHHRLPALRRLLALIWPNAGWSPALAEWRHLSWARGQQLPVPDMIAAGEFIGPWGRFQSFLAVKELAEMLPLHQAIPLAEERLPADEFRQWKCGLASEMARLAAELHCRNRFHKDLYLCHFYIASADTARQVSWKGRVYLIDFHRLGHHRWTWPWWLAKDLGQLWYSSEIQGIGGRDRLFFWRAYRRANPEASASKLLRALVSLKAWNYRRHSRRGGRRSIPESPKMHSETSRIPVPGPGQ